MGNEEKRKKTKNVCSPSLPAGYQDEDLKNRLLEFARASASLGWQHGPSKPTVSLYSGSYLPQHEDPKIDKGLAKIQNCSEEELRDNQTWGGMYLDNTTIMKKKLTSGQVRRNINAGKDSHSAIKSKENKTAATWFQNSLTVGAQFGFFVRKRNDIPNEGAAGPTTATVRPTSASSSSRPVPTTPPRAETKSKAAARSPARPAAPAASSTPLPKFITAGSASAPKARPCPRPVVLYTYSVGVNHLLEGQFSIYFTFFIFHSDPGICKFI